MATAGVHAQEARLSVDETRARIEQLEKEVQALKTTLQTQTATPAPPAAGTAPELDVESVKKVIEQWSKEKTAREQDQTKAQEEQKKLEGSVVGEDLKLNVGWDAGGLRFRTADEAFSLHIGGRLMSDEVWWAQSPNLRRPPTQPANSPLSNVTGVGPGIGDLLDGFFVRRARFTADGAIFQTIEYKVELDFENYNNISFDESYVGARDLPIIETFRFGQTHVPFGLEAYTSSRFLPMLERSPLFDAFYQEFAPGIFTDTTFFDQRVTTQHMFHRIDSFSPFNGASFGDGKYAYSGRVSALPVYENDGRCLLHLGFAYQIRKGSPPLDFDSGTKLAMAPNPSVTENTDLLRFRARPGIRDAVGLQGNGARVVDTGNIIADDVQALNAELLWYWGPLWVQSEACLAHVDNAVFPASSSATRRGDLNYYGSYVQVGYFLTGDNRGYDKRMGKYDRVRPLENFFLVRDENGHLQYGLGAWEILYRYGYINLNDDFVQGGTYGEHTVGLNWYWNPNIKFQLNYINGQRLVPAGAASGTVQGLGLRAALEF
ncbi:MAG TPA: porin [Gemmataceae bacterium]|nr:porin [Gemmataceae bacterium]